MEPALSADVVAPLGAGAVALIVALIAALTSDRRGVRPDPAGRTAAARSRPRTVAEVIAARGAEGPAQPVVDPAAGAGDVPSSPAESASRSAEPPVTAVGSGPDRCTGPRSGYRADARDRLLAVLLDDPVRAVGAAVELDRCRMQLDELSDALRHERAALGGILRRLIAVGLRPEQLSRLAGLSLDEVLALLEPAGTHQPAVRSCHARAADPVQR
ncbi:MAG: hypothetical protein ACRDRK_21590 [Pseudonocardia sp.]